MATLYDLDSDEVFDQLSEYADEAYRGDEKIVAGPEDVFERVETPVEKREPRVAENSSHSGTTKVEFEPFELDPVIIDRRFPVVIENDTGVISKLDELVNSIDDNNTTSSGIVVRLDSLRDRADETDSILNSIDETLKEQRDIDRERLDEEQQSARRARIKREHTPFSAFIDGRQNPSDRLDNRNSGSSGGGGFFGGLGGNIFGNSRWGRAANWLVKGAVTYLSADSMLGALGQGGVRPFLSKITSPVTNFIDEQREKFAGDNEILRKQVGLPPKNESTTATESAPVDPSLVMAVREDEQSIGDQYDAKQLASIAERPDSYYEAELQDPSRWVSVQAGGRTVSNRDKDLSDSDRQALKDALREQDMVRERLAQQKEKRFAERAKAERAANGVLSEPVSNEVLSESDDIRNTISNTAFYGTLGAAALAAYRIPKVKNIVTGVGGFIRDRAAPVLSGLSDRAAPVMGQLRDRAAPLIDRVRATAQPLVTRAREAFTGLSTNMTDYAGRPVRAPDITTGSVRSGGKLLALPSPQTVSTAPAQAAQAAVPKKSFIGRGAGIAGAVVSAAMLGSDIVDQRSQEYASDREKNKDTADIVGRFAGDSVGMFAGMKAGAALGSLAGPIGTVIGGALGSVGGYLLAQDTGFSETLGGIASTVYDAGASAYDMMENATLSIGSFFGFERSIKAKEAKEREELLRKEKELLIKQERLARGPVSFPAASAPASTGSSRIAPSKFKGRGLDDASYVEFIRENNLRDLSQSDYVYMVRQANSSVSSSDVAQTTRETFSEKTNTQQNFVMRDAGAVVAGRDRAPIVDPETNHAELVDTIKQSTAAPLKPIGSPAKPEIKTKSVRDFSQISRPQTVNNAPGLNNVPVIAEDATLTLLNLGYL